FLFHVPHPPSSSPLSLHDALPISMVDARLPDGSRVNAVIPPLTLDGPTLSIRRFGVEPLKLEDLLRFGSLLPEIVTFIAGAVEADRKSTRLNSSHRTISYAVFCLK